MSTATPIDELLIEKLRIYLKGEGYSGRVQRWYPARARHFLEYCNDNTLAVEAVRPAHWEYARGASMCTDRPQR